MPCLLKLSLLSRPALRDPRPEMEFNCSPLLCSHLVYDGSHSGQVLVTGVDVSPHELLESVQEKAELKVRVIVLVVGLKDLHVEEDDTGQEGLVSHLVKEDKLREIEKRGDLLKLLFKLLLLSN